MFKRHATKKHHAFINTLSNWTCKIPLRKNVVQTNEVRKNLENSFKVKIWFKQMEFVETLVNFQKNTKEPPCNILQRLKFF